MFFFRMIGVFLLFVSLSWATTFYVDNDNGDDENNGTSISKPWRTIAKVNSFKFSPGDIILFKRGESWRGTLTVKQDGSSSHPIIFGSYGEGDLPVIDGSNSRSHGIYMDSRNYVIMEEFSIRNTTHGAVRIQRSENVIIRNNEIYVTGRAGVFIEESSNCLITNNVITTPSTHYNAQTDGIYAQRNSEIIYEGNYIVISNQHVSQHCDGIQTYLESDATIRDNYIEQNNSKMGNAQGIYCSENYGTFRIFNNVGYGMNTTSGLVNFYNSKSDGKVEIIGNTLYGGRGGLVQSNDPYIIFKK
jgi:parallel beta-helix repeat protein